MQVLIMDYKLTVKVLKNGMLHGARILGKTSTTCIVPFLQKGHLQASKPVRRLSRSCEVSFGLMTILGFSRCCSALNLLL